ncbi:MAG: dockerin type I repeat-containing protein [Bacillota bacterium]|nr:dockerin type I repeat-containing protein [Bacillota bacterium]
MSKKIIALFLSIVLMLSVAVFQVSAAVCPSSTSDEIVIPSGKLLAGDANQDNIVSLKDVSILQKYFAQLCTLPDSGILAANVTGDKALSLKSACFIQKFCVQMINAFPCGRFRDDPRYKPNINSSLPTDSTVCPTNSTSVTIPEVIVAPTDSPIIQSPTNNVPIVLIEPTIPVILVQPDTTPIVMPSVPATQPPYNPGPVSERVG